MLWFCVLFVQTGATPLHVACKEGHLPVVEYLIAVNADLNTQMEVGCLPLHNAYSLLSPSTLRSKLTKEIAECLGLPGVHSISNILPYLHLCCAESNGAVILCMYGKHTPELDTTVCCLQEQVY